jgi:hypothetical protein
MGASVKTIDKTYGHLAQDSDDHLRDLLAARSGDQVASGVGGDDRREAAEIVAYAARSGRERRDSNPRPPA